MMAMSEFFASNFDPGPYEPLLGSAVIFTHS